MGRQQQSHQLKRAWHAAAHVIKQLTMVSNVLCVCRSRLSVDSCVFICRCRVLPVQADPRSYASAVGAAAPDTAAGSSSSSTADAPGSLPGGAAAPAASPRAALVQNALIWVDLEMTGLDPRRDSIIEIAVIITDGHLQNEVAVRS
jgi:Exonuclease